MTYECNNSSELQAFYAYKKKTAIEQRKKDLQTYFEWVRDNLDIFDREYYVAQLEAKGFKFERGASYESNIAV